MLNIVSDQITLIILFSIRVLVILSFVPVLSGEQSPVFIRIVLAFLTVFSLQQFIPADLMQVPQTAYAFLFMIFGEALIGALIGFFVRLVFLMLSILSEFFTTQMGLRAAQIVNPITQTETVIIQQFISFLVLIVFLSSFTLQKIFFYGILQSFYTLSAEKIFAMGQESFLFIFAAFFTVFQRSFLIAFPIFAALFLVNIGLGLVGKVAPQMNVLILGIPIQIAVGFIMLIIFIPNIVHGIEIVFDWTFEHLRLLVGVRR